ncbi:sulfate transporter/antisigma-factor antagonist [Tepidicaulis marinus]|uniref:Sulfate transporter/antisigma-factor antagonist n=1 Tax=Tepidicaulis marinus TaxID=1333998 RepID=A0A081B7M8_9HYPH|nr:SulP family inorganic anion transporter [Tepidicaulis marinus]GAK44046.1 sulfate transporter/antisigma-factor antagonist [Tepidicaulis marinus]
MPSSADQPGVPPSPGFAELYTPKLVTVLKEGYGLNELRADILAGLTVAIVALPLSMAIAIASGTSPDRGLYTAIIGGFLVSLLGGSRFQIGGPAGAFIVLVAGTVAQHGIDGLILATFISGLLLAAAGFLRLGTYIKFIPYPVTVGFTAGIAVIIAVSQIKDLLGLPAGQGDTGSLIEKLSAAVTALPEVSPAALLIAALTIALILALKAFRPGWPGMLIAIAAASLLAFFAGLPVETIGTKFGGIARTLPLPALPDLSAPLFWAVLPNAFAFTLLGAIESLLSAVVADGMTGRRHRSNCELVAQGAANIGSALFGGMCVTGTIARTATNVRAGARGPVAGMCHALFLLAFMLIAAPLASYIPLAALAGVLVLVAWNMIEKHAIAILVRTSPGDTLVLSATFLFTVFRDLTEGIIIGFSIGTLIFLNRMAKSIRIEHHMPFVPEDKADWENGTRAPYDAKLASDPGLVVYRISGAFFFGSASTVAAVLDRIAERPQTLVLDFSDVPFLDSTAANTVESALRKARASKARIFITGTSEPIRKALNAHGIKEPEISFAETVEAALKASRGA